MLTISNYQIDEKIYESSNSIVYRCHERDNNNLVILKMLKQAYPSPEKLAYFKREYEITKMLSIDGVINVYSLESYQNCWFIVLEDFGGESLEKILNNRSFDIAEFWLISTKILTILAHVHQQHIIHKDINPSNIVWNPSTQKLKLIDFGISTQFFLENQIFSQITNIEGTLAYISPEQTGRTNQKIDHRTDFYSLGVTFYELLTRQLPFLTTDAAKIVHSHIAKQPVAPHHLQPKIPQSLSDIVMKLMAKNPEDRYKSAYGIQVDLEECQQRWKKNQETIHPFLLGQSDTTDRFQIPQKLYGREVEIQQLLDGFARISQGQSEIMLVTGYSGIGKSSLVLELYKQIAQQQGYFIAGKFDQYQRDIPYNSLIQAFRSLLKQLLTENEVQITVWREKLLTALGGSGQIIIDAIAEVELIVGSQPALPKLEPIEAQNRFNQLFQNFVGVFAQREHPLVLFLDDLQWADEASLKLIQLLISSEKCPCLYIVGAYRDNEVSSTHPLMLALEDICQANGRVGKIDLNPLELGYIKQLVSDTCKTSGKEVDSLADLVMEKTYGNPFFANLF